MDTTAWIGLAAILLVLAGLTAVDVWALRKNAQTERQAKANLDKAEEISTQSTALIKELMEQREVYVKLREQEHRFASVLIALHGWMGVYYTDVPELEDLDYHALFQVPGFEEVVRRVEQVVNHPIKRPEEKKTGEVIPFPEPEGKLLNFPLPGQRDLQDPRPATTSRTV